MKMKNYDWLRAMSLPDLARYMAFVEQRVLEAIRVDNALKNGVLLGEDALIKDWEEWLDTEVEFGSD